MECRQANGQTTVKGRLMTMTSRPIWPASRILLLQRPVYAGSRGIGRSDKDGASEAAGSGIGTGLCPEFSLITGTEGASSRAVGAVAAERRKSFHTEREARLFEADVLARTAAGDVIDPCGTRVTLSAVYKSWLASRLDLSPKVRRGYEDVWRLRLEPRFGSWAVGKIDHASIQSWISELAESGP
jgi:hypothetical protein